MSSGPVRLFTGLLLALAPAATFAQESTSLAEEVAARLHAVDREQAIEIGFRLEELDGTVLVDYHGDRHLALASNTKLYTTAAALLALGADYRWHTRAYLESPPMAEGASNAEGRGQAADPVLRLVGGGDPSLRLLPEQDAGAAFLDGLAKALQDGGHTRISTLLVDGSAFPVDGPHPLWPKNQLSAEYTAPLAALTVAGALMQVRWNGRSPKLSPPLGKEVRLRRMKDTGASLSAWWGNEEEIRVRIPNSTREQEVAFAQRDPLRIAAWWVAAGLSARGIEVGEVSWSTTARTPPSTKPILDWPSAWTLGEAVVACNKDSDNFLAETLLLTLGHERAQSGDWPTAATAALRVLKEAGLTELFLEQVDGSGLARDWPRVVDASTPKDICALLRLMSSREEGRVYFDSLPIGGVDGSLKDRFREAAFQPQRIHAKTGFILGASSLSGYLLDDDHVLVFSFVVNFDRSLNKNSNNRRFIKLRREVLQLVLEAAT